MNFIKKVKSSVYDPEFYKEIKNKSFGFVWGYFTLLVLVLSVVLSLVYSVQILPTFNNVGEKIRSNILSKYPAELEVKFKNGEVSTNVSEPYFVKLSENDFIELKNKPEYAGIENALVIDTKKSVGLSDFEKYKTLVWLAKDSIVIKQDGKVTIQDLGKNSPFELTISKANLETWLEKFSPIIKVAKFVLPVAIFIGYFIAYHFLLLYFLLVAFLVFILGKIMKLGLGYKDAYKVTVFASTLSILLKAILWGVLRYSHLPFVFTLITLVIVYVNFKNYNTASEVKSNEVV